MPDYEPIKIESKWQKIWDEDAKSWQADDSSQKPKFYSLFEFPYPSGDGLHMGHLRGQTAVDVYGRKKRLEGYNVMNPIGWDAFGLPTENYAIKHKIQPALATEKNIESIKAQEKSLGYFLDWNREINTSDPSYYKWTQWIFLQLFKHGLAYKADMPINWCPSCKIGLANEEVIDNKCERCDTETGKRKVSQWVLKITKYADRLIDGLKNLDFPERVKTQQINWIGKSEGTNIKFVISVGDPGASTNDKQQTTNDFLEVFTTRPDTIYGATFMVIAPEHKLLTDYGSRITNKKEVDDYIIASKSKSDLERADLNKEKTGVEIKGIKAVNPINGEELPIFVADYVLSSYGSGAIMAVPAHDERDYEFATKYKLPIKPVVARLFHDDNGPDAVRKDKETIKKKTVYVLVKHWNEDKYLCLKWPKYDWHSGIIGGIDEGEDVVSAGKREIIEETGFKNPEFVKEISVETHNYFFAPHKDVNRYAFGPGLLFKLKNDEWSEPKPEDTKNHHTVWVEADKMADFLNLDNFEYLWEIFTTGKECFVSNGVSINSELINDLKTPEAKEKITKWLEDNNAGEKAVTYKLRDWIFSRQHYWGEPIPIIFCRKCWENQKSNIKNQRNGIDYVEIDEQKYAIVPISERDLPVELPEVENYQPTDTGESPLAKIDSFVNTTCPKCGEPAKRETDTMPNWAGSSWYFIAYALNQKLKIKNQKSGNIFSKDKNILDYWFPVDLYEGGMEHTTLHLLYSRFWHQFLYDIGVVPTKEPYQKRVPHGIILAKDGRKMSKSIGNVIRPDELIKIYGADTVRTYVMFIGPHDQAIAWDDHGLEGVSRFLKRVWINIQKPNGNDDSDLTSSLQKLITDVSNDIELFQMNTAVAKLMEFNNLLVKKKTLSMKLKTDFLTLLYPFAPHLCCELNQMVESKNALYLSDWPKADEKLIKNQDVNIVVQINSKNRAEFTSSVDINDRDLEKQAVNLPRIKELTAKKTIKKIIVVKNRLVNLVID